MSDKLQFVARSRNRVLTSANDKLKFVGQHQSNFKYFLFTQPRSAVNGSTFCLACCSTCTSYQLSLTVSTLTRDPFSASPIGSLSVPGSGRRFKSVVVTPSRPMIKVLAMLGMFTSGFQCEVT